MDEIDAAINLESMIRRVVKEEINTHHDCKFAVTDKDAADFSNYIGMIANVGDGTLGNGLEIMRDNHKWLKLQRDRVIRSAWRSC